MQSREIVPTVMALRQRFEAIRLAELQRLEPKLAGLPPEARARIDEVTRLIVEKLLLTPTEQLKSVERPGHGRGVCRCVEPRCSAWSRTATRRKGPARPRKSRKCRREETVTALRIGTRGSALALWQARTVAGQIEQAVTRAEIIVIKTGGDRLQERPLSEIGGKRLFVKEIEDALLAGDIDIAVHSAKDMSAVLPEGLDHRSGAAREDPRDVLVLPEGTSGSVDFNAAMPHSARCRRSAPAASAVSLSSPRPCRGRRSGRSGETSIRDCGSSIAASSMRWCSPPRVCGGSVSAHASRPRFPSMCAFRPPARVSWRSRFARTTPARARRSRHPTMRQQLYRSPRSARS